jgi:hypothetical protein
VQIACTKQVSAGICCFAHSVRTQLTGAASHACEPPMVGQQYLCAWRCSHACNSPPRLAEAAQPFDCIADSSATSWWHLCGPAQLLLLEGPQQAGCMPGAQPSPALLQLPPGAAACWCSPVHCGRYSLQGCPRRCLRSPEPRLPPQGADPCWHTPRQCPASRQWS